MPHGQGTTPGVGASTCFGLRFDGLASLALGISRAAVSQAEKRIGVATRDTIARNPKLLALIPQQHGLTAARRFQVELQLVTCCGAAQSVFLGGTQLLVSSKLRYRPQHDRRDVRV